MEDIIVLPDIPETKFFRCSPAVFPAIMSGLNAARGYPKPSTAQALPDDVDIPKAGNGDLLLAVPSRRINQADSALLAPLFTSGALSELSPEEFEALL